MHQQVGIQKEADPISPMFSFQFESLDLEHGQSLWTLWSFAEQVYDYLIVIDFESTCWKDGKHHNSPEISNFGLPVAKTSAQWILKFLNMNQPIRKQDTVIW